MKHEHWLLFGAFVCWAAAWMVVGSPESALPAAMALGVAAVVFLVFAARGGQAARIRMFAAVAVCAAGAALICASAFAQAEARSPTLLRQAATDELTVRIEATITTTPTAQSGFSFSTGARIRFEAVVEQVESAGATASTRSPALVFASVSGTTPSIGTRVGLEATVQATSPGEQQAFLVFADGDLTPLAAAPPWLSWAEPLRAGMHAAAAELPGDGGDLLPGLSIGDTTAVSDGLDAAMKHASLSHLTAVSGANCAVVVAGIMAVGAALGLSRSLRTAAALAALGGFVVLVTPEASVLRAAVMATIALLALAFGRPGRGVVALAVTVIILLVLDPWSARSYGLALSALATAGLLLGTRPITRLLGRWMPLPLAVALAVPTAAQLACQPVLILLDATLPLAGVAANLLAEPAAVLATVLGLLACLTLPWLAPVGWLLLRVAWLPSAWIAAVARFADGLPFARLPWLGGVAGAVLLAAVTALSLWLVFGGRRRNLATTASAIALVIVAGAYGGALTGSVVIRALTIPKDWMFAACDIGQGDAVLIRDGTHVGLVDVGPDPRPLTKCLDTLHIARIDLLVLTHYDLDHVGGLDAVIGRVDRAIVGLPATANDARIPGRLQAGGASVGRGSAGMTGSLGELSWSVVWPDADAGEMMTGNAGSVTVVFQGRGVRSVFLGDLGAEAQDALLELDDPGAVDVVKVAHHGSADQSEALYQRLRAAVGLISVGIDNSYGHPTEKLLGILSRAGTVAERTDRQGMILVEPGADGSLTVWSERRAEALDVGGGG